LFSEDQDDQASGNSKLFATPFSSSRVFHSTATTSKKQIVISACPDKDRGPMLNNMDTIIYNTTKVDGALSSKYFSAELRPPEVSQFSEERSKDSYLRTPTITTEEAKKEDRKERNRKQRQKKALQDLADLRAYEEMCVNARKTQQPDSVVTLPKHIKTVIYQKGYNGR